MRFSRWVACALGATLAPAAGPAAAQCTTCSPLSLPSGSLVGADLGATRRSAWAVQGVATTGWVSFPRQVADNQPIETRDRARFDLFLTTLQASVLHRSGLGVDVVVPVGFLAGSSTTESRRDFSLGDVELKPRATTLLGRSVRLTGAAGVVLPTGGYTPRSGAGALGEASRVLTIGRGVYWGIAEAEARVEISSVFTTTAMLSGRVPAGEASDGFQWGPELRGGAELEGRPTRTLGLAAGAEVQARGSGSIVDPFLGERVASDNVGATLVSLTAGVRFQASEATFLSLSARLPVYQDLDGLQFQQGIGVFGGVAFVLPVGAPRGLERPESSPSTTVAIRYIVREYGADWCTACKRLEPALTAAQARRADLRVERVDVTEWSQDDLRARVPGASALPIVEIRRGDGSLVARLEGEGTFAFEDHLQEKTP